MLTGLSAKLSRRSSVGIRPGVEWRIREENTAGIQKGSHDQHEWRGVKGKGFFLRNKDGGAVSISCPGKSS